MSRTSTSLPGRDDGRGRTAGLPADVVAEPRRHGERTVINGWCHKGTC
ncbi:hypothetical protein ACFQ71_24555 [Streptomyces sp. NPDC056534]